MKTKLLSILFLLSAAFITRAQCSGTSNASLVVTSTATMAMSDPFVIKVCSTGIAYDTTGNNGRIYYLETGAQLYLKMHNTTLVYMKTGSSLTIINNGSTGVYKEVGATVTGTPNTSSTCTAVSFPGSPSCAPTGIKEISSLNNLSIYPNPAEDNITISNPSGTLLNCTVINSIGQKVKSFTVEGDKKTINISDLNKGIYYFSFSGNGKSVVSKKITVLN